MQHDCEEMAYENQEYEYLPSASEGRWKGETLFEKELAKIITKKSSSVLVGPVQDRLWSMLEYGPQSAVSVATYTATRR